MLVDLFHFCSSIHLIKAKNALQLTTSFSDATNQTMRVTATFILLMPPLVCAQSQNQMISVNQRLRGPVLSSHVVVGEYDIKSDEVATSEVAEKVNVIVLTEAGCPDCQESVAGPLNAMITSPGFADILNVRQFRLVNML